MFRLGEYSIQVHKLLEPCAVHVPRRQTEGAEINASLHALKARRVRKRVCW